MASFAVCPGSYDPITLGHLELIRRARGIFDRVVVLVMENSEKHYRFSAEERTELCRVAVAAWDGVEVAYSDGMLYEYLLANKGAVLVKGFRNETDLEYERHMAAFNRLHAGAETLYLEADENFSTISSTAVRERIERGEDYSALVSPSVWQKMKEIL